MFIIDKEVPMHEECGVDIEALLERWRQATGHISSPTDALSKPPAQRLLELGDATVRVLFKRDASGKELSFNEMDLLYLITRANLNIPIEHHGILKEVRKYWRQWAKEHGYLEESEVERLLRQYDEATAHLSNTHQALEHPLAKRLIELGSVTVRAIFRMPHREGILNAHLMGLLRSIVDGPVIPEGDRGYMRICTEHWYRWARENSYL